MLAAEPVAAVLPAFLRPEQLFCRLEQLTDVALAVSGGSDSMAMLCLADEWRKTGAKPNLHVLTVDHGLRVGSAEEAQRVGQWCSDRGLPHHVLRWQHDGVNSGLQARARQARYELMTAWCKENGVGHLLTAHTRDDQAETVFMRQKRTATLASLAGVWRERDWNEVTVVRPLLDHGREELRAYLRSSGQGWIDDPSNDNPVFERVRIRSYLAAQHDEVSLALAETAIRSASTHEVLLRHAADWIESNKVWHAGYAQVARDSFESQSHEQAHYVLQHVIQALGGLRVQPSEVDRLADWLKSPGAGRRTLGCCLFSKRSRSFLVGREPGRIGDQAVVVPASGSIVWDRRFLVEAAAGSRIMAAGRAGCRAGPEEAPAFVRAGWPVIFAPQGSLVETKIEFRPYLR